MRKMKKGTKNREIISCFHKVHKLYSKILQRVRECVFGKNCVRIMVTRNFRGLVSLYDGLIHRMELL